MTTRKLAVGGWIVLATALGAGSVGATSHEESDGKFNLSGEVRTRWDYSANVFDADDDGDDGSIFGASDVDDDFDFLPYRVRIAANGAFSDNVFARVEMQGYGFFGNDSTASAFAHPIGQGFGLNDFTGDDDSEIDLYQGYLHLDKIGGGAWSLRAGRQEHTLSNELMLGDLDFYNGRSFDGMRAMGNFEDWDLDLFYYMIDEQTGSLVNPDFDEAAELWGATGGFELTEDGQSLTPYVLFKRHTGSGSARERVYTFGAQYGRAASADEAFDWSVELALQGGEVGSGVSEEDVSASIIEGWFGYSWGDSARHRAHVGMLVASGDDDLGDSDAEAFMPLFEDDHAHNRLGDIDLFGGPSVASGPGGQMSNVTDINVGYKWTGDRCGFMASLHNLTLTEEVGGEDDLGMEVDLAYNYKYSDNVGFQVGVAQLAPGDLLDAQLNGTQDADDVRRAWWQLQLTWD